MGQDFINNTFNLSRKHSINTHTHTMVNIINSEMPTCLQWQSTFNNWRVFKWDRCRSDTTRRIFIASPKNSNIVFLSQWALTLYPNSSKLLGIGVLPCFRSGPFFLGQTQPHPRSWLSLSWLCVPYTHKHTYTIWYKFDSVSHACCQT